MKHNEIQYKIASRPIEKRDSLRKKKRPLLSEAFFQDKKTCSSEKNITFAPIFER